jgi:peptidoglycan/xylan/chitin deacetylase (PgdA/CDA1 family)
MLLNGLAARVLQSLVASMPRVTTHVLTGHPVVALTFDDGPHAEFTPALLEILEEQEAQATFFMLGEAAVRHPAIVTRVAGAGHAIGNHSWGHRSLPWLSGRERRWEIRQCAAVLGSLGQPLFRPPYGDQSLKSWMDARWLGYEIVTWNVDVKDWACEDPELIATRLLDQVTPGSIVLLHDNLVPALDRTDRIVTLRAVELFLRRARERFQFVTIPELFRHGRRHRQPWYQVIPRESVCRRQEQTRNGHAPGAGVMDHRV